MRENRIPSISRPHLYLLNTINIMRLQNIPKGSNRPRKRVGKGEGNGLGKTSGRGQKGQKSRSGYSQRPGFESGHIPLYRRLPRRGFNNSNFSSSIAIVNLSDLEGLEGDHVDPALMKAKGLVRNGSDRIKVLGDGEISRALNVSAHKFSASAIEKIEKAGGRAIVLETEAKPAKEENHAEK